ncbi:hypothetical protein MAR_020160, partial [Mya arenaria]
LCDGRDLFSLIGRRDISSHCCTTDLCNRPGTTTEVPTTVPTTTSLMYCSKDIYIAVETFLRHGHETEMDLVRQFLATLSSALPPGNQISIAKFGSHLDIKIKFHEAQDPQKLQSKINDLSLTASTLIGGGQPHVDFQRLGHDLVSEIQHNHNGARTNVPNSVLIITNNRTDLASHSIASAGMLNSLTSSVTVLNIGSPNPTLASIYATNSNHEIAVPNYQGLMRAIPQVVSLLCS